MGSVVLKPKKGARAAVVPGDISKREEITGAIDKTVEDLGSLDVRVST